MRRGGGDSRRQLRFRNSQCFGDVEDHINTSTIYFPSATTHTELDHAISPSSYVMRVKYQLRSGWEWCRWLAGWH
jgi:hypothetical protein